MIPCAELTYIIGGIPTASSASQHMRSSIVRPLRGPIDTNANTLKLRMIPICGLSPSERPSFTRQKAAFHRVKCGLLQSRWASERYAPDADEMAHFAFISFSKRSAWPHLSIM